MQGMTLGQLERAYRRVFDSMGYGGHFGWDWPTLQLVYPEKHAALKALGAEIRNRLSWRAQTVTPPVLPQQGGDA